MTVIVLVVACVSIYPFFSSNFIYRMRKVQMGEKDSSLLRKEKRHGLSRKSILLKTCLEDIERFSKGEVQHFQKGNEITNRLFRP